MYISVDQAKVLIDLNEVKTVGDLQRKIYGIINDPTYPIEKIKIIFMGKNLVSYGKDQSLIQLENQVGAKFHNVCSVSTGRNLTGIYRDSASPRPTSASSTSAVSSSLAIPPVRMAPVETKTVSASPLQKGGENCRRVCLGPRGIVFDLTEIKTLGDLQKKIHTELNDPNVPLEAIKLISKGKNAITIYGQDKSLAELEDKEHQSIDAGLVKAILDLSHLRDFDPTSGALPVTRPRR